MSLRGFSSLRAQQLAESLATGREIRRRQLPRHRPPNDASRGADSPCAGAGLVRSAPSGCAANLPDFVVGSAGHGRNT